MYLVAVVRMLSYCVEPNIFASDAATAAAAHFTYLQTSTSCSASGVIAMALSLLPLSYCSLYILLPDTCVVD